MKRKVILASVAGVYVFRRKTTIFFYFVFSINKLFLKKNSLYENNVCSFAAIRLSLKADET